MSPGSPASSRPPAASQPQLHSGGAALPTGCLGQAPPKGGRCTPSSWAPPGIRKQSPEEEGESGYPGTMPTALCPQPQRPGPPAPRAGTHLKPPSSCHLAFPRLQCHSERGPHARATQQVHGPPARFWVVGVRVPDLHGATWLHPPSRLLHQSPFLGHSAGLGSNPRRLSEPVSFS